MFSLLAALLLPTTSYAITDRHGGPVLDLGAGFALGDAPAVPQLGLQASLLWWTGEYDEAYAFGRYWAVGVTGRVDWRKNSWRVMPMLEVRNGMDLFVAGVHGFGAVGPLLSNTQLDVEADSVGKLGVAARAGIGLKLRRSRFVGINLRLEGGADYLPSGKVGGAFGALIGFGYARPLGEVPR